MIGRPPYLEDCSLTVSSKLDEPVSIFKAACEQFRASLSEKQRQMFKEYSDAKSMLAAIQSQAEEHPTHRSVLTRCCKKIAALSTMLEPYFEVINLFVSSHPEFAGIAWGSLRLVFTVRISPVVSMKSARTEGSSDGNKPCPVPRACLRIIRDHEPEVASL